MQRWLLWPLAVLGPLLALAAVWVPEVAHYWVQAPRIDDALVQELRVHPGDQVLTRLDQITFDTKVADFTEVVANADGVLDGRYRTPSGEVVKVALEPTDVDLELGGPADQLEISSMAPASVLLKAYGQTKDERYFKAALKSALGWARYERQLWRARGFVWNDHAVAARMLVLATLWGQYRHRSDFDTATAREILQFALRSAILLSRPNQYNARTNHGVMQDLALFHASLAFPLLPGTAGRMETARQRMDAHLRYYVTPSGVVLEHSTGYQDYAIHLLRTAGVYFDLLGEKPPADLAARLAAAECMQRQMVRPDGTVPVYGDTWNARRPPAIAAAVADIRCPDTPASWVDEDFGYARLAGFDDGGSQLFVSWANFAGRAHKHDDELAIWPWLSGRNWWGASGYWPYADPQRGAAVSWRGNNAPHGVNEAPGRGSTSTLDSYSLEGPLQFLDVERVAADGRRYRRQLLALRGGTLLVLDSASGPDPAAQFETVWTMAPGVQIRPVPGAAGRYVLEAGDGRATLAAAFHGPPGYAVGKLHGSRDPFAGLVAVDSVIRPTDAIVATAPVNTWLIAAWQPPSEGQLAPVMTRWLGPTQWTVAMRGPGAGRVLTRAGTTLSATMVPGGPVASVALQPGAHARPGLERATAAYRDAVDRYPPYRDLSAYRLRATLGIGALAAAQCMAVWLLGWLGLSSARRAALVTVGWIAVTGWLYFGYLV